MDNLETSLVNSDSSPPLEKPKISITGSPLERLNKGQLEFCVAYSNFGSETYHNATLSAIKAGYSVKTAGVKGSRLVSHSKTRAGIDYLEKSNDVELAKVFDIERPVFLKEMVDSMRELDAKAPNRPRYAEIIAKVKGFYSDGINLSTTIYSELPIESMKSRLLKAGDRLLKLNHAKELQRISEPKDNLP